MSFQAIVVLGCRVEPHGRLSGAAARRVARAARAYDDGLAPQVVTSGGKRWHGVTEAAAFEEALVALGVPRPCILREEHSLTTVENARYVARLARAQKVLALCVVTCDWHMARARAAFAREGLAVAPVPAAAPELGVVRRSLRYSSERLHATIDRFAARWERPL